MKAHSKVELQIMAAQAKALARSAADPQSARAFVAIAQRLEQEAAALANDRRRSRTRPIQPRKHH